MTVTTPAGTTTAGVSAQYLYTQQGPYTPVAPYRICDTRTGNSTPCTGQILVSGGSLDVQVAGTEPPGSTVGGVPSDATAAVLNVTAVGPTNSGYLTVYPTGTTRAFASSLNFVAGQTVANLVTVALGVNGQVTVFNSMGMTNVVVDVEGYISASSGSNYTPITPLRICDTRTSNPSSLTGAFAQCNAKTLAAKVPLAVQVTGLGSIPASASGVVMNVTVTSPHASGYLTVYPAGESPPLASNVDFSAGQTIPNGAAVKLPASGAIDIVSNTSTNVILDVEGYYSTSGSTYIPIAPERIADTRCSATPTPSYCQAEQLPPQNQGLSAVGTGGMISLVTGGINSIPLSATAVGLNVTVTSTASSSFLTVYPAGSTRPTASSLNWVKGATVANVVIAPVGSNGTVEIYNYSGSTDVVVDIEGYYS